MKVFELINKLRTCDQKSDSDIPVLIMTPEIGHSLTYYITDVIYNDKLDAVIIDVQKVVI